MSLRSARRQARAGGAGALLLWCALLPAGEAAAQSRTVELSGQASGWVRAGSGETRTGLRYLPELSLAGKLPEGWEIGSEAAVQARWSGRLDGSGGDEGSPAVDLYRLWARLASSRFEVRAGLQKINFGSAALLRPLRWFDGVDPRDPLQVTEGVHGLLGRYYLRSNANIWVWALYGNDALKGWETMNGEDREIEFGGRGQLPVRKGEMGLSYHQRRVDPEGSDFGARHPAQGVFAERRIGLDGKWDLGVGLWFEGTVTRQALDVPAPRYERLLTVGLDYTLNVGNGPHLLFEHLLRARAEDALGSGDGRAVSGLSAEYPLSLLDTVSAIVHYDWESEGWSRFLAWRRAYDRWQVQVSAFWNPGRLSVAGEAAASGNLAGSGLQLLVVFNH